MLLRVVQESASANTDLTKQQLISLYSSAIDIAYRFACAGIKCSACIPIFTVGFTLSKTINGLAAGSYLGASVQSLTSSKIISEENITEDLQVRAMPNPSNTNFRIVLNSNNLKAPVKLIVSDMLGRVIETRVTNAGQTITIGDKYISGTYAVRIMQGRKIRQLSLIKLSD